MKEKFSLNAITKFIKDCKRAVGNVEHALINPNRDWTVVACGHLLLLIGLMLFGTYTFINIQLDLAKEIEMTEVGQSVDETLLDESLDYFDTQQAQYTDFAKTPPPVVDPFE